MFSSRLSPAATTNFERKVHYTKTVLGVLVGMLLMMVVVWYMNRESNPGLKKIASNQSIAASGTNNTEIYDERIVALNKRLDDLLVFGGIVITLLLGINAGVFVNAERQVDSYLHKHYGILEERIRECVVKAENMVEQLDVEPDATPIANHFEKEQF